MRRLCVEEIAEGIPSGAVAGLEGFVLGEALRVAEQIADTDERCSTLRRNATMGRGAADGLDGMAEVGSGGKCAGKRSKFAEEIVLARSARGERAVSVAEAVEGGMSGHSAVTAVGKGEAAKVAEGIWFSC